MTCLDLAKIRLHSYGFRVHTTEGMLLIAIASIICWFGYTSCGLPTDRAAFTPSDS